MNLKELIFLKDLACKAALAAGEVIKSADREVAVEIKDGGSTRASQVVTEVDFKAQQAILEVIEPTLPKHNLGLLSEEQVDDCSRFEKEYFWAIDPLDGTLAFLEGKDGFAVSISLIGRDGIPRLGVVYDPVNDRLLEAIKDNGASCNKEPLLLPRAVSMQCHFIIDKSTKVLLQETKVKEQITQKLKEQGLSLVEEYTHYGAVMNICKALEYSNACFFKLPKAQRGSGCIWDYGAMACIYTEAGGLVTDCFAQPLSLNSPDTVFMNRCGVVFASREELIEVLCRTLTESISSFQI